MAGRLPAEPVARHTFFGPHVIKIKSGDRLVAPQGNCQGSPQAQGRVAGKAERALPITWETLGKHWGSPRQSSPLEWSLGRGVLPWAAVSYETTTPIAPLQHTHLSRALS